MKPSKKLTLKFKKLKRKNKVNFVTTIVTKESKNANSTSLVTATRAMRNASSIILYKRAKCILTADSATDMVAGIDIPDHATTINKDIVNGKRSANIFI